MPLALEGMLLHYYEVSGANSQMTDDAIRRTCVLTGDLLTRLVVILLNEQRMRDNLAIIGGLITSEAVMLSFGESIDRQHATRLSMKPLNLQ